MHVLLSDFIIIFCFVFVEPFCFTFTRSSTLILFSKNTSPPPPSSRMFYSASHLCHLTSVSSLSVTLPSPLHFFLPTIRFPFSSSHRHARTNLGEFWFFFALVSYFQVYAPRKSVSSEHHARLSETDSGSLYSAVESRKRTSPGARLVDWTPAPYICFKHFCRSSFQPSSNALCAVIHLLRYVLSSIFVRITSTLFHGDERTRDRQ